jgi:hypothetical protein
MVSIRRKINKLFLLKKQTYNQKLISKTLDLCYP